jgi:hypothetical protein
MVKLYVCLTNKHYAMKKYGGVFSIVGGEWSASRPCRFAPGERASDIHGIGGWVGPGTGLDNVEKRKMFTYWDSNSDSSAIQPVSTPTALSQIPSPGRTSWG